MQYKLYVCMYVCIYKSGKCVPASAVSEHYFYWEYLNKVGKEQGYVHIKLLKISACADV